MGKLKDGQKHHWVGYQWIQKNANNQLEWMDEDI